jgi:hypothetical protein
MPGYDRLVPDQIDLAVREALAGVHVGAARFDVIAADLLGICQI